MVRALPASYRLGSIVCCADEGELRSGDSCQPLTGLEEKILRLLCANPEKILTAEFLHEGCWGGSLTLGFKKKVENQICTIRKKCSALGEPELIENSRGRGYRLRLTPTPVAAEEPTRLVAPTADTSESDFFNMFSNGVAQGSRVVVESPLPFQIVSPHASTFWSATRQNRSEAIFVLDQKNTRTGAKIYRAVLDAACEHAAPDVWSLLTDDSLLADLLRIRVVFVPRSSVLSLYIKNAENPHAAVLYIHDIQGGRAIRLSEREVAASNARDMLAQLPEGRQCVQFAQTVARLSERINAFKADLVTESAGTKWAHSASEILRFLLQAQKPMRRASEGNRAISTAQHSTEKRRRETQTGVKAAR